MHQSLYSIYYDYNGNFVCRTNKLRYGNTNMNDKIWITSLILIPFERALSSLYRPRISALRRESSHSETHSFVRAATAGL